METRALEIVQIENWKLVENSDESFTAQKIGFRLRGSIFGHPEAADGTIATTSEIIAVDGLDVMCASRIYKLGAPSAEYLTVLAAQGYTFNGANPLQPYLRWLIPQTA